MGPYRSRARRPRKHARHATPTRPLQCRNIAKFTADPKANPDGPNQTRELSRTTTPGVWPLSAPSAHRSYSPAGVQRLRRPCTERTRYWVHGRPVPKHVLTAAPSSSPAETGRVDGAGSFAALFTASLTCRTGSPGGVGASPLAKIYERPRLVRAETEASTHTARSPTPKRRPVRRHRSAHRSGRPSRAGECVHGSRSEDLLHLDRRSVQRAVRAWCSLTSGLAPGNVS
jgi:hypothetical protein